MTNSLENLQSSIDSLRNRILDYMLLFGIVLGSITYIVSLFNYSSLELKLVYLTDFIGVFGVIIIYLFRKHIPLKIKSVIIIILLIVLVYFDTILLGVFSNSKTLLIIIPFFSFIVFNLKNTIYVFFISMLGFILIGVLIITKNIPINIDFNARALLINQLVINSLLIGLVSVVIIIIIKEYNSTFISYINKLNFQNEQLFLSEENYKQIFNSTTDAFFIQNEDGTTIDVNDSTLNMYGYTKDELLGISIEEISAVEFGYTKEKFKEYFHSTISTNQVCFDWLCKNKTGNNFWVEIILKRTKLLDFERIIVVVRNINERKKIELDLETYTNELENIVQARTIELQDTNIELTETNNKLTAQTEQLQETVNQLTKTQEHLIKSEKMASLGILSAGIAHEINNPLNYIQGGADGIEFYVEENLPSHKQEFANYLEIIYQGVNKTATIVQSLNTFSQYGSKEKEKCEIHTIINHCLVLLQNKLKNKVEIVRNYASEDLYVYGNQSKLHQVFLNILSNSEQAIESEGLIVISTTKSDSEIIISIKDTGKGIPSDNIHKIFDPFFTTKEPGEGAGLGLSISYHIINEHSGKINYIANQKKGTTAIISLPEFKV